MVSLVVPVVIVGAATAVGGAAGDVVAGGVAGDVDGDGAAGDKGAGEAPAEWWCAWRRCREVLLMKRVLLVMPWVRVRGWWGGEGDSAVGRDGGLSGVSGVGQGGDAVHSLYRAGTKTPDGGC